MSKQKTLILFTVSVFLIYCYLLAFPQLLFKYAFTYKSFKVYSHDRFDHRIYKILDSTEILIEKSELYDKHLNQKIFFCNNFYEFSFFALIAKNSFAVNYPFLNNIFVASGEIKNNTSKRNGNEYNVRTLNGVLAHELTHTLIFNKLKLRDFVFLEKWKNEGYCDYIAQETTLKYPDGIKIFCQKPLNPSNAYKYFEYWLIIDYLFTQKNQDFNLLLQNDYKIEVLKKKIENSNCSPPSRKFRRTRNLWVPI